MRRCHFQLPAVHWSLRLPLVQPRLLPHPSEDLRYLQIGLSRLLNLHQHRPVQAVLSRPPPAGRILFPVLNDPPQLSALLHRICRSSVQQMRRRTLPLCRRMFFLRYFVSPLQHLLFCWLFDLHFGIHLRLQRPVRALRCPRAPLSLLHSQLCLQGMYSRPCFESLGGELSALPGLPLGLCQLLLSSGLYLRSHDKLHQMPQWLLVSAQSQQQLLVDLSILQRLHSSLSDLHLYPNLLHLSPFSFPQPRKEVLALSTAPSALPILQLSLKMRGVRERFCGGQSGSVLGLQPQCLWSRSHKPPIFMFGMLKRKQHSVQWMC